MSINQGMDLNGSCHSPFSTAGMHASARGDSKWETDRAPEKGFVCCLQKFGMYPSKLSQERPIYSTQTKMKKTPVVIHTEQE